MSHRVLYYVDSGYGLVRAQTHQVNSSENSGFRMKRPDGWILLRTERGLKMNDSKSYLILISNSASVSERK